MMLNDCGNIRLQRGASVVRAASKGRNGLGVYDGSTLLDTHYFCGCVFAQFPQENNSGRKESLLMLVHHLWTLHLEAIFGLCILKAQQRRVQQHQVQQRRAQQRQAQNRRAQQQLAQQRGSEWPSRQPV